MRRGGAVAVAALLAACATRTPPASPTSEPGAAPEALRIEPPEPPRLAVGGGFTCVVSLDDPAGPVSCWGSNAVGQLGRPGDGSPLPVAVPGTDGAVTVAAGAQHACAALSDGDVVCWGFGNLGQTGTYERGRQAVAPERVPGVTGATHVSVGDTHSCARLDDGRVQCWGLDELGEVTGRPPPPRPRDDGPGGLRGSDEPPRVVVPAVVEGLPPARSVTSAGHTNCVVDEGGAVWCWGREGGRPIAPVRVQGVDEAVQVAVGRDERCALLRTGAVTCWHPVDAQGVPVRGPVRVQVLERSRPSSEEPPPVDLVDARELAAGDGTCARRADGSVACWVMLPARPPGWDAGVVAIAEPVRVPGGQSATIAAHGVACSLVVGSQPSVACWSPTTGHPAGEPVLVAPPP